MKCVQIPVIDWSLLAWLQTLILYQVELPWIESWSQSIVNEYEVALGHFIGGVDLSLL